ncbi:hypothetical protein V6A89_004491 [Enterobacter hormaechei]
MKKYLLFLLLASFGSIACMTGHWESASKSSTFTLDLVQAGEHVAGKYCFITNNGNRIDCAEKDDDDNIHGYINNGVANIKFESTFGGKGNASMRIKDGVLLYDILDKTPFTQANMSVPSEIKLKKK